MKKLKKHDFYILCGIFIFVTIILSNFLKMHYAQDTYHTEAYGFSYTAKNAFLFSGRPITATAFYIADILNLNIETHVLIMTCFSIINLTLTVYILYMTIKKLLGKNINNEIKYLILIVSFITVFNFCTTDLLVFSESGIVTMGLLFSIIAGCEIARDKKNKYIKTLLYAIIGVLCYQGILNIYVPIALIFIVYKNKGKIKEAFKEAFIALSIYGIALIASMIVSSIISKILVISSRPTIIPTLQSILNTYLKYLDILVLNTLNIGPKYWYITIIAIISIIYFIVIIRKRHPKIYIFYYIAILLSTILLPILPLVIQAEDKQYLEPRMCMSFGASAGIAIMYATLTINIDEFKLLDKILKLITILIFVINSQYIINSSSEMVSTNLLDRNFAIAILNKMEKYEKENHIEIKNIGIDYDTNLEFYYNGAQIYRCLNLKSLATDWAIEPILKIYGNRESHLKLIEVPDTIHTQYFKNKNWTSYSEEQIVFEGDTMYICIY